MPETLYEKKLREASVQQEDYWSAIRTGTYVSDRCTPFDPFETNSHTPADDFGKDLVRPRKQGGL